MIFAITISEMGLGKVEILVIFITILVFPTLFFIASKNLDPEGVFKWMMEKPDEWVGKDRN